MRRSNIAVFNDQIPTGTSSASPVYTSTELLGRLGQYDKIALQAIVDNISGTTIGTFTLKVEHSADGRNFAEISGNGMTSINNLSLGTAGDIAIGYGYNTGEIPFLGYVRFKMYFSNGTTSAHVRVLVTQRDEGG